jgi:hypothetical protein
MADQMEYIPSEVRNLYCRTEIPRCTQRRRNPRKDAGAGERGPE